LLRLLRLLRLRGWLRSIWANEDERLICLRRWLRAGGFLLHLHRLRCCGLRRGTRRERCWRLLLAHAARPPLESPANQSTAKQPSPLLLALPVDQAAQQAAAGGPPGEPALYCSPKQAAKQSKHGSLI
jgi:hypothetical protein